jgi:hypothetical protein
MIHSAAIQLIKTWRGALEWSIIQYYIYVNLPLKTSKQNLPAFRSFLLDERDEEGFAGDGLGAFDFEIKGSKLMAFSVAVVIVGLVEYAVFIVLTRRFEGGLPVC